MEPLLKIAELHVHFRELNGNKVHALNGADLQLAGGEVLGILGESGCGKSTLARALMRLLPKSAQVSGGTIQFAGQILLDLSEGEMRRIRGAQLALILSEPGQSLNPVMRAGDQIAEVIHAHREGNWKHCRAEAVSLLERVHLSSNIRQMYDAYPHQLSGEMCIRDSFLPRHGRQNDHVGVRFLGCANMAANLDARQIGHYPIDNHDCRIVLGEEFDRFVSGIGKDQGVVFARQGLLD